MYLKLYSVRQVEHRKPLESFADQIMNNLNTRPQIPGNRPYKKAGGGLVPKPTSACTKCGICTASCPVKAISTSDFSANSKLCISCMRCVEQCPEHTRSVNRAMVKAAAPAIRKACSIRKDNELFQ
ncbi:MAG: 4Fe-4S binding protein [Bulleidia sp.]